MRAVSTTARWGQEPGGVLHGRGGGDGWDAIRGATGDDDIYGGDGEDTVIGGGGNDTVDSGDECDVIEPNRSAEAEHPI